MWKLHELENKQKMWNELQLLAMMMMVMETVEGTAVEAAAREKNPLRRKSLDFAFRQI